MKANCLAQRRNSAPKWCNRKMLSYYLEILTSNRDDETAIRDRKLKREKLRMPFVWEELHTLSPLSITAALANHG